VVFTGNIGAAFLVSSRLLLSYRLLDSDDDELGGLEWRKSDEHDDLPSIDVPWTIVAPSPQRTKKASDALSPWNAPDRKRPSMKDSMLVCNEDHRGRSFGSNTAH